MKESTLPAVAGAAALAVAIALGFWWASAPRSTRWHIGMSPPDVELPLPGTTATRRLSQFRGRPVLFGVFDTTTPPGRSFVRALEAAYRRYHLQGLEVAGVALDADPEPVIQLSRGTEPFFVVFHDPRGGRLRAAWGTPQEPEGYLLDARGQVVAVYPSGFGWPDRDLENAIRGLLPRTPGKP